MSAKQIVIFLICFLLSFVVTLQVRTVNENNSDILRLKKENELRDELNQWKDAYNNLSAKNAELNKKIDDYRNVSAGSNDEVAIIKEELDESNIVAGLVAVKGEGIRINIDVERALEEIAFDAGHYDSNVYLIHDKDIMAIINELVLYGAEAICVNGQRITSLTGIKNIGPVISINGVNTSAPFIIEAIGDSETLVTSMGLKNGKIDELRNLNIDITLTEEELVIPGYEGKISLEYSSRILEGGQ